MEQARGADDKPKYSVDADFINKIANLTESVRYLTYIVAEELDPESSARPYLDEADRRIEQIWALLRSVANS